MILELVGSDYKYAAEQMMLTMYPGEKPVYGRAEAGTLSVRLALREGKVYTTASAVLYDGAGGRYTGYSRARNLEFTRRRARPREKRRTGAPLPGYGRER